MPLLLLPLPFVAWLLMRSIVPLREHPRGLADERPQQRELLLRQDDALAVQAHLARRRIDLERARAQATAGRGAVGTAQEGGDAAAQLRIAERLADRMGCRADLRWRREEQQQRRHGVAP
jgi:hypothetical protein